MKRLKRQTLFIPHTLTSSLIMRDRWEVNSKETKLSHPTIIHHSIWYGSWDGERRRGLAWDLPSIQNRNILEWINLHWTVRLVSFSYSSQVSPLNSIDRLTSTVSYSNVRHVNYLLHSLSHLSSFLTSFSNSIVPIDLSQRVSILSTISPPSRIFPNYG